MQSVIPLLFFFFTVASAIPIKEIGKRKPEGLLNPLRKPAFLSSPRFRVKQACTGGGCNLGGKLEFSGGCKVEECCLDKKCESRDKFLAKYYPECRVQGDCKEKGQYCDKVTGQCVLYYPMRDVESPTAPECAKDLDGEGPHISEKEDFISQKVNLLLAEKEITIDQESERVEPQGVEPQGGGGIKIGDATFKLRFNGVDETTPTDAHATNIFASSPTAKDGGKFDVWEPPASSGLKGLTWWARAKGANSQATQGPHKGASGTYKDAFEALQQAVNGRCASKTGAMCKEEHAMQNIVTGAYPEETITIGHHIKSLAVALGICKGDGYWGPLKAKPTPTVALRNKRLAGGLHTDQMPFVVRSLLHTTSNEQIPTGYESGTNRIQLNAWFMISHQKANPNNKAPGTQLIMMDPKGSVAKLKAKYSADAGIQAMTPQSAYWEITSNGGKNKNSKLAAQDGTDFYATKYPEKGPGGGEPNKAKVWERIDKLIKEGKYYVAPMVAGDLLLWIYQIHAASVFVDGMDTGEIAGTRHSIDYRYVCDATDTAINKLKATLPKTWTANCPATSTHEVRDGNTEDAHTKACLQEGSYDNIIHDYTPGKFEWGSR